MGACLQAFKGTAQLAPGDRLRKRRPGLKRGGHGALEGVAAILVGGQSLRAEWLPGFGVAEVGPGYLHGKAIRPYRSGMTADSLALHVKNA